MLYYETTPPPVLADVVQHVSFFADPNPACAFQRVLPTGEIEIVINLSGDELRCYDRTTMQPNRLRGAVIAGIHHRYIVIDTQQLSSLMSLRLKPGAVWRLFGVPAAELADSHVELSDLIGSAARELSDKLTEARFPAERLRILTDALGRRERRELHPGVASAVKRICQRPHGVCVATLAAEAGLSMRRFGELFAREIGTNPKTFVRIQRFQAALAKISTVAQVGWSALAAETGYSDQAHLIREFREFSGMTPAGYLAQGAPRQVMHEAPA
jgi:AraC-like DNA-binding protein